MLKVSHLSKSYGERKVVDDLSFEAVKGKIYGFLGPNGAGKSTTMSMITGFLAPDDGTILINDISMVREPGKARKQVGYLPEVPPLYPDLTVEENLSYAAELKGLKGKEKKAELDRVCERMGLKYVRQHLVRQISKGYKQRTGLAEALLADPEIIILDEPSSGLDPRQIAEMRELVRELREEHTVLFSTHILSEVDSLCDHVMVLSEGKLLANDTPEKLLAEVNAKQRLTMVLKGASTAAERIVKSKEEIESFTVVGEDSSSCTIRITAKAGEDLREELSKSFSAAGMTVLELSVQRTTLEEVYLDLTYVKE
ncbi:MAG: ABC transporter ATP-binding protein [Lachnospiraceae bacterium]|nr:ABC transporter ATP-binding protein [Lachnospiraceae bacterium]